VSAGANFPSRLPEAVAGRTRVNDIIRPGRISPLTHFADIKRCAQTFTGRLNCRLQRPPISSKIQKVAAVGSLNNPPSNQKPTSSTITPARQIA
jgi:hypothetical protein